MFEDPKDPMINENNTLPHKTLSVVVSTNKFNVYFKPHRVSPKRLKKETRGKESHMKPFYN